MEKPAKAKPAVHHGRAEGKSDVQVQELLSAWKDEIAALQAAAFADEAQAIEAVVSRVLERLKTPLHLQEPTRLFLSDLFATDPGLREELRECLKIRERGGSV